MMKMNITINEYYAGRGNRRKWVNEGPNQAVIPTRTSSWLGSIFLDEESVLSLSPK
jgi:hypothetical protein